MNTSKSHLLLRRAFERRWNGKIQQVSTGQLPRYPMSSEVLPKPAPLSTFGVNTVSRGDIRLTYGDAAPVSQHELQVVGEHRTRLSQEDADTGGARQSGFTRRTRGLRKTHEHPSTAEP